MKQAVLRRIAEGKDIESIGQELCPDVKYPRKKVIRILKDTLGEPYLTEHAKEIGYQGSSQLGKKKYYTDKTYLFNWNNVPGTESKAFIDYLMYDCMAGWVKEEFIFKSADHNSIKVSAGCDSLSLNLNTDKTKAELKINDNSVDELITDSRLNVYKTINVKKISHFDKLELKQAISSIMGWLDQLKEMHDEINIVHWARYGLPYTGYRINTIKSQLIKLRDELSDVLEQAIPEPEEYEPPEDPKEVERTNQLTKEIDEREEADQEYYDYLRAEYKRTQPQDDIPEESEEEETK